MYLTQLAIFAFIHMVLKLNKDWVDLSLQLEFWPPFFFSDVTSKGYLIIYSDEQFS